MKIKLTKDVFLIYKKLCYVLNETAYGLNVVFYNHKTLQLVATNGHILRVESVPKLAEFSFTISPNQKTEDVEVKEIGSNNTYPDYEKCIPDDMRDSLDHENWSLYLSAKELMNFLKSLQIKDFEKLNLRFKTTESRRGAIKIFNQHEVFVGLIMPLLKD